MKRHLEDDHLSEIKIAPEWRVGVIAARFNGAIVEALLSGAQECLNEHGVVDKNISVYRVPGCFELALMAQLIAQKKHHHALICIGAIIRGDTPHFDYVAAETARGIAEVARRTSVPLLFGVLTTNTLAQAWERAGKREQNNGWNAARAALEMLTEITRLEQT